MNKFKAFAILATITALALLAGALTAPIFGESEKDCIKLNTNEIIKIENRYSMNIGGCDWLVGKILGNESGFKFADHDQYYDNAIGTIETWILIK